MVSQTNNNVDINNVDINEINKFETIASRWWDLNGEFKPLHDINPIRLDYINNITNLKGKNVVDIGCGGGILSESMSASGAHVTGIDMGEGPLTIAKLHLHESGLDVNYIQTTAEKFAQKHPKKFDVVTCMELLEHVPDPQSTIKACAELVKPDGYVFFSTINRNPKAYALAVIGAEYLLGLLPKGTHDYAKFIKPSELEDWGRSASLSLKGLRGINYNPLTKYFSLSRDVSVNYIAYSIVNN